MWGPASATMELRTRLTRYLSPPLFPVRIRDLDARVVLHDASEGAVDDHGEVHVSLPARRVDGLAKADGGDDQNGHEPEPVAQRRWPAIRDDRADPPRVASTGPQNDSELDRQEHDHDGQQGGDRRNPAVSTTGATST
jgi:hypothetical protein